ncbi:MAG: hypothetical protein GVY15_00020 [Bacteroidetes bacterium]|jgi:hypothetical protein|nr:hypothetical protein [Bacteroidota bacterium]
MRVLVALSIVLLWMGNDEGSSFAHPFDHVADQTHNTAFARAPLKIVTEGEEAWSAGVADDPDGLLLGNVKDVRLVFWLSCVCCLDC